MKRLFLTLVVLFILYFGFQIVFKFQSSGFINEYTINSESKEYKIKEVYTANTKGERDSYHITINYNNITYDYVLYDNLNKMEKIVKDIKNYENCIYPIFKDGKQYFDITCKSGEMQTYYHDMNPNSGLNNFADTLKEYGYSSDTFKDKATGIKIDGTDLFYKENMVISHFVGMQHYRGIYTICNANPNKIYSNEIFNKDVYNPNLSALINNFYVVADYDSSYNFNKLYVINLKNNVVKSIEKQNVKISFDSYIQGVVKNSLYLFDPSNKKQYEVNVKSMTLNEVGNEETKILYYSNDSWTRVSVYEAINKKLYFDNEVKLEPLPNWDYQQKVGGKITGVTYYFKKEESAYRVYKSNGDSTVLTYLFKTTNIDNIAYQDAYVYFINGDELCYYSDATGVRRLYKNNELKFNKNLKIYVYK